MSDYSREDINDFCIEATELIDDAEETLLGLEKDPETNKFPEGYAILFRAFHSIKGGAGMLGLTPLQGHFHQMENFLSSLKNEKSIPQEHISYFLEGIDAARSCLSSETPEAINIPEMSPPGKPQNPGTIAPKTEIPKAQSTPEQKTEAPKKSNLTPTTKTTSPVPKSLEKSDTKKIENSGATVKFKNAKGTVYILDDETDITEILRDILSSVGIQCETFNDGTQCVEKIKTHPPAVLITDMQMPKITGLEVFESVRKTNPDIPIIFISAYLNKNLIIESMNQGLFGCIEKPFEDKSVISLAKQALKHHQTMKLLLKSIRLVLYQFSNLDKVLKDCGKTDLQMTIQNELKTILNLKRSLMN